MDGRNNYRSISPTPNKQSHEILPANQVDQAISIDPYNDLTLTNQGALSRNKMNNLERSKSQMNIQYKSPKLPNLVSPKDQINERPSYLSGQYRDRRKDD